MTEIIKPSLGEVETSLEVSAVKSAKPSVSNNSNLGMSSPETIAAQIGTGEHARDSFIWMTLKYCFNLAAFFSMAIIVLFGYFLISENKPDKVDIVSDLKDIWSIFTPIITLALGYAFGKRERGH